ncbi:MAG: mechanosensitive ion channel family protein, partial [Myxococcales bacterium]|nr:mechanosensitive ion channel family protein [Myxococcales bacterium]
MTLVRQILDFAQQHAAEWSWRMVAALATLLLAWIAMRASRAALHRTLDRSDSVRVRTLRPIVQGLITVSVLGIGMVLSLEQLGFDLTAVIAGAGGVGLAIGFGSQELV